MSYDVRSLANAVLEVAMREGRHVSNVYINKIVYFIHADYLVERGQALCDAKIEAWTYGPVYRELYSQFKRFGSNQITEKAKIRDRNTGELKTATLEASEEDCAFVEERAKFYLKIDAFKLVDLSHVEGGPWDQAYNHSGVANPGMEITDDAIAAYHRGISQN